MLIQEAIDLDVHLHMIDPDPNAPCALIAHSFTIGSITDYDTEYNFGKTVDLLTIEIENVNIDALEKLEQEGTIVYPQTKVLRIVQDKGLQKQFYKDNNIPTSDFELLEAGTDLTNFASTFPKVQKLRKFGYDGKGVNILRTAEDISKGFESLIVSFEIVFSNRLSPNSITSLIVFASKLRYTW
jgi:5-(carboxyamino)imidazole ribonucleotide synthase